MRRIARLSAVAALAASVSCGTESSGPGPGSEAAREMKAMALEIAGPGSPAEVALLERSAPPALLPPGRQLVRNAELEVVVYDVEAAAHRLAALADSLGGYVASGSAERREDLPHHRLSVRVPAQSFETLLAAARQLARRVEREARSVEDVTERVVDLGARLRTLRATEEELQALLAESRESRREVEDIMAVHRELTSIRSSIESMQAQLESLQGLVALSTVELVLVPDAASRPVAAGEWRPGSTTRAATRSLLVILRSLGDAAIFVAIVVVPVGALVLLPLALVMWAAARVWRRMSAAPASAGGGSGT